MSVHSTVEIGAEFLGFRIEAPIGHGGMGVVYRAYDVRLKRTVALKLMAPDLATDERFRDRFSRESELAMALEHPNVVPIYDAGEADGRLYIAMRYVEGTDLRTELRDRGALECDHAVAILKQVAHALDAAHARRLVHRDVKPSNVLLDRDGHAYLADFGLTRRLADEGPQFGDGRSLGTPAYLAPEQIEGRPVDGRADVYSLGCMLFECLTGTAPFFRASRLGTVWAHLEEEPPSASERNRALPEAIDAVIRRAMSKEPDERYPSCGELAAAAEKALGLEHTAVSPRRRLLILAVMLLIASTAFGGVLAARGGEDAAGPRPVVRANSLVRIDPATNAVTAVVEVGENPVATAVAEGRVWVYNRNEGSVSEVDAATSEVRHTTPVSASPGDTSVLAGPMLAADPGGAWVIGYKAGNENVLTRIRSGGRGKREYRLRQYPSAVVVAEGAVWVLANGASRSHVLQLNPRTGTVTRRIPVDVSFRGDGLAVGGGAAWIMDSSNARLYRVDLRTGVERMRDLGDVATPPIVGFGSIWICAANPGSSMLRLDPRTFRTTFALNSIPAEQGRFAVGYGSLWRHDYPSGTVMRFDPATGKVTATVRVSPKPPMYGSGLTPTAIAAGASGIWVTVARI